VPNGWEFVDQLRPYGLQQQLVVPITGMGPQNRSILLAQGESDFTDGQLELAKALQPLLMLLERHMTTHGTLSAAQSSVVAEWGLTGRETAVLRLLAAGRTVSCIAGRLGCSRRTVDKHVEHLYRKLGVHDRVSAARLAFEHGLVEATDDVGVGEGTQPATDGRIAVLDGTLRPFTPELLG
jgi:DNA-binding CsgD family transcriptional regulator